MIFENLAAFCAENQLEYNNELDKQFHIYYQLLSERNKVMNLTAVTNQDDVELRHFIDSLTGAQVIHSLLAQKSANDSPSPDNSDEFHFKIENPISDPSDTKEFGASIIDIGTGAGFPGMPLALMMPDYAFTLADSLNKRIQFLQEVIDACHLDHVKAIPTRAEDAGQGSLRESFDFCVSRAVAETSVLLEYMLPLVKIGGFAILYKSGIYQEELSNASYALELLGGCLIEVKEFILPGSEIHRSLIIIEKIAQTPVKYPRRPGKPVKSPLKNNQR